MHVNIHRTKIYGMLVFHFYLKHMKGMEPKSILGVTSTCNNPCATPSGHGEGDMAYVCSLNLQPFLMKSNNRFLEKNNGSLRVKSGIFGQTAKSGQRPCLFHISNIGIKNKIIQQTVKILTRRLIRKPSHLDLHCLQMCVRIYLMSDFT